MCQLRLEYTMKFDNCKCQVETSLARLYLTIP
jgi:hypothetical protein